mgnify:CR=1 FL=1
MTDRACAAVASGFYLSYIPIWFLERTPGRRAVLGRWTGAGFIGTALGLASLPMVPAAGGTQAAVLTLGTLAACFLCGRAERHFGGHDDPRIILDETVGFWAAVAFLPRGAWTLAAAFALFRVFDALKPPPCRALERLPGGFGIVMDDIGAGILTNLALRLGIALGVLS